MRHIAQDDTLIDGHIRETYIQAGSRGTSGVMGTCVQCQAEFVGDGDSEQRLLKGRSLCMKHYQAARRGGYLSQYPRTEVYGAGWVQGVLDEAVVVHGDDALVKMLEQAVIRATNEHAG